MMSTGDTPSESKKGPSSEPSSDPSSDANDGRLFDELRAAVNTIDPVPERLMEGARSAFVWRTIDEELAQLTFDSLADSEVLVRSGQAVHLRFAASEAGIEVEIADDAIIGQVVPPATAVRLLLKSGEQLDVACDEFGQFTIDNPPSGPIRLVVVFDGGSDVATEWFTV